MVSKQVRVNLNYTYREDDNGGVVIFFAMEHTIVKIVVCNDSYFQYSSKPKIYELKCIYLF